MSTEIIDKETKWVYENYTQEIKNLTSYLERIKSSITLNCEPINLEKIKKNNFEWFNYYHQQMFLDAEKIENDLVNFYFLLSNKNNMLYGDHTIAYRLINLAKLRAQLSEKNHEVIKNILDLDFLILSDESFTAMSKGYNHAVDQLFGLICYHHYVESVGRQRYDEIIRELKDEIFNSVDECFIHVENTPDYHYYAMQRLTAINDVVEDSEFSELLVKMNNYLSYVTPEKGMQIINVGDSAGKYVWNDLKNPVLDTLSREPIKFFKTGYLAYTKNSNYFYIKSSKKHWNHHHYDNTSYVFWKGRKNFIVDSGAYSYEHDNPYRIYCLSPFAHNIFCVPDTSFLYSNYDNVSYSANSIQISEKKFLFQVKMYEEILVQRVVTLNQGSILFEDSMSGSLSALTTAFNLIHCNPDSNINKDSENELQINLKGDSIKIKVLSSSAPFTTNLIFNGIFEGIKMGYYSDKFYSVVNNPTILFKFANLEKGNIHFSYLIEY